MDMAATSYQVGSPTVESDYLVGGNTSVAWMASKFVGNIPSDSPEVNPLRCSLSAIEGLNPQLILAGAAEFALYDSKEWAQMLKRARVEHELVIEWAQMHIFAMSSAWIDQEVRAKTDRTIINLIKKVVA
jgi:acetyl esterase/lipase